MPHLEDHITGKESSCPAMTHEFMEWRFREEKIHYRIFILTIYEPYGILTLSDTYAGLDGD